MKVFSSKAHAIIGILMGIFVTHIPGIFGFWGKNGAADAVAIAVGTIILLNELTADDEISPVKLLPLRWHVVIDVITGGFLALSPWLFNYSNLTPTVWLIYLFFGALIIGFALATDTGNQRISLAH